MSKIFSFPHPVNEYAARSVAACVCILTIATIITSWLPLAIFLAYGFWARVLTGPSLSPIGQFSTRIITTKFIKSDRPVARPPKRFAQAIGVCFSTGALICLLLEIPSIAQALLIILAIFAFLESAFGFCAGCKTFSLLMKIGLVPAEICERCNNLSFD